ncbi:MAG: 30S ribosomal protein S3 [Spirochaetota bacterium]|nr:30S ribosomal protein S3 [Spirochaetota bacterium]
MGQKVNPIGFRLGYNRGWDSKWYVKNEYADYLHEDLKIREFVKKRLQHAEVGKIEIIRYPERVTVNILTARPGLVIGKKGSDIEVLKKEIQKLTKKKLHLNIMELRNTSLNAQLVANHVAKQIEGRVAHKRAMKQAIQNTMKAGGKGVKIIVSGRLGGAEMARVEHYKEGRIPLHTIRAEIDYGSAESLTTFGKVGIKVWIFKGETFGQEKLNRNN